MLFQLSYALVGLVLPLVQAMPANSFEERDVPAHIRGKRSFYDDDGVNRTVFEHEATGTSMVGLFSYRNSDFLYKSRESLKLSWESLRKLLWQLRGSLETHI